MRIGLQTGALAALAWTSVWAASMAHAEPSDYVSTPIVEEGEREIDFKAGTAKSHDGLRENADSLGFGWGANNGWFTEMYAKWHKEPGAARTFDAWEWENKFQLTETGRYPVDIGLLLEIERPNNRREGYELRWGPLLQTDLGSDVQANLNLLLQSHVRSSEPAPTLLDYQWQLKYRWRPEFEYGLQGFGELGPWRHAPGIEQSNVAGPVVSGRFRAGDRRVVRYNVGLLFGLNDGAPRNTLRMQAEYEF